VPLNSVSNACVCNSTQLYIINKDSTKLL